MLPPPMLEMGPCLAVPHSDLLRMVPIPGMVFSAEFKHKELLLLFWFFGFLGFWGGGGEGVDGFFVSFFVFKGESNSSSAARH